MNTTINTTLNTVRLSLSDLVNRDPAPQPWVEGDNIPWDDPEFSQRMLQEHLSQDHDKASRKREAIDQQVRWIHTELLAERPGSVLDLGCGPGLYTERLARLGHRCVGVDFAPAAVAYARQTAQTHQLDCQYLQGDLRTADFGADQSYDLVMQIFGELNVFSPDHARLILRKAHAALKPGGTLLLEVSTEAHTRAEGQGGVYWFSGKSGLFAAEPHIVLAENFWDEAARTATVRYYVIDAATGAVTRWAQSMQMYTPGDYSALLAACGFGAVQVLPGFGSQPAADAPAEMQVLLAKKE